MRRSRVRAALAALCGLLSLLPVGCTGSDLPSLDGFDWDWWSTGGSGGGSTSSGYCEPIGRPDTSIQGAMLEVLNVYRVANGLDELLYSDTLEDAASYQARDLYVRDFFDHTNPDGEGPLDRAKLAGFCQPRSVGENIAMGYQSVDEVQIAWQNSPGHNANMLRTGYVFAGMGHYTAPNGVQYWVQVFGTTQR